MIGHISGDTYEVLMRQGLARGLADTRSRGKGADGQGEEQPSRPLTGLRKGGDRNPIGMGKAGASKTPASDLERQEREPTPASRRVLRLVVDNGRNGRARAPRVCPPGARPFLALVKA